MIRKPKVISQLVAWLLPKTGTFQSLHSEDNTDIRTGTSEPATCSYKIGEIKVLKGIEEIIGSNSNSFSADLRNKD